MWTQKNYIIKSQIWDKNQKPPRRITDFTKDKIIYIEHEYNLLCDYEAANLKKKYDSDGIPKHKQLKYILYSSIVIVPGHIVHNVFIEPWFK